MFVRDAFDGEDVVEDRGGRRSAGARGSEQGQEKDAPGTPEEFSSSHGANPVHPLYHPPAGPRTELRAPAHDAGLERRRHLVQAPSLLKG